MASKEEILDLIRTGNDQNLALAEELINNQEIAQDFCDYEKLYDWLGTIDFFYKEADIKSWELWYAKSKTLVNKIHLIISLDYLLISETFQTSSTSFILPSEFILLESLEYLLLSKVSITIEKNLEWPLSLHTIQWHDIKETFPKEMLKCSTLKCLAINFKNKDEFKIDFKKLPHLEELDLSFIFLKKLPDTLKYCKKLKRLALGDWRFELEDKIPDEYNKISNLIPILKNLKLLEELTLRKIEITNPKDLFSSLTNLKELRILGANLQEVPLCIKDLNKLKSLDVAYNYIDSAPKWIKEMPNLIEYEY